MPLQVGFWEKRFWISEEISLILWRSCWKFFHFCSKSSQDAVGGFKPSKFLGWKRCRLGIGQWNYPVRSVLYNSLPILLVSLYIWNWGIAIRGWKNWLQTFIHTAILVYEYDQELLRLRFSWSRASWKFFQPVIRPRNSQGDNIRIQIILDWEFLSLAWEIW